MNGHRPTRPAREAGRACRSTVAATTAVVALVALAVAPGAHAALGESTASIAQDRSTINAAAVSTTAMPAFVRHEMRTPDGTTVREFASPAAGVFALDFAGPVMPDLKVLLGTRYDGYVAAARARHGVNHHFLSFEKDGLAVRIVKLPRGFEGHARLPAAMPAGVGPDDLQ